MNSTSTDSASKLKRSELIEILNLARWAPSGDNWQPWRVRNAVGNSVEVLLDSSQKPAFLDVNLEGSRMAIGAFIENCRIAASSLGMPCEVTLGDTTEASGVWATLEFAQRHVPQKDELAEYITARVSNRRPHESGSCTTDDLNAIASEIRRLPGVDVQFYCNRDDLETIAAGVAIAERVRMRHRQCHEEFHAKVHWTEEESQKAGTGFSVKTFEIKPHEVMFLRLTRSYRAMRSLDLIFRVSAIAAGVAKRLVLASGAVGMLQVQNRSPAQVMRAGCALQRAWLAATARGLAFQVLAVAHVFIRRAQLGGEGFAASDSRAIRQSRDLLALVPNAGAPEDVALMFRVGHAAPPTARTPRLPAEALLL